MPGIDRQSSVPLVYQLSEILRRQILTGEYKPNSQIPTEDQLMEIYGVSRTPVRLALQKLVNEGLIRRERGRGSFVNPVGRPGVYRPRPLDPYPMARDMIEVKSMTYLIESAGMTPGVRVLTFQAERPTPRTAELLELDSGEMVWRSERVRLADETPVAFERVWLPQSLCPDLTRGDLEGSLYRTLSERYGCQIVSAHQVLKAITVDGEDAERLALPNGHPVMLVTGVSYLADGRPIEVEQSLFRGDMMEFVVELGVYSKYARFAKDDDPASPNLSRHSTP